MEDDVLYEKGRIKVTYLHSPEPGAESEVISREDHELWINRQKGEVGRFILQRGILKELADTARKSYSELARKLEILSPFMRYELHDNGITLRDAGQAFIEACQTEEERFDQYLARRKTV